ncbi:388_t:CDS:2 [Dentiscutata erythropus]|uniref:388_t:CDS:1 n=1 Tax=Dentiscutata erythropus TaxID=1348616 RepID=A0A9N9I2W4_9GLOM|nr:388_t:CDS:2 [Dentiscutata erythropus]
MDTPRRKSRKPNKYLDEIGVVGRKTGITISGEVTKNADGLEDLDAFFNAANSLKTTNVDEATNSNSLTTINVDEATNVDEVTNVDEATNVDEVANSNSLTTTNVDEVSMSLVTDESPQETTTLSNKRDDSRVVLYRRRAVESPKMAFNLGNFGEDNTDEEREPSQDREVNNRKNKKKAKNVEDLSDNKGRKCHKVIRIPRPDDNESGVGRNTKRRKRNGKNTTLKKGETDDDIDEVASAEGFTIDWETNEKVTRRLIYTLSMYQTETIDNDGCKFQKTFSEGDFFSAGLIDIPKGRKKSGRNSNESAMGICNVSSRYANVYSQRRSSIFCPAR